MRMFQNIPVLKVEGSKGKNFQLEQGKEIVCFCVHVVCYLSLWVFFLDCVFFF